MYFLWRLVIQLFYILGKAVQLNWDGFSTFNRSQMYIIVLSNACILDADILVAILSRMLFKPHIVNCLLLALTKILFEKLSVSCNFGSYYKTNLFFLLGRVAPSSRPSNNDSYEDVFILRKLNIYLRKVAKQVEELFSSN